MNLLVKGPLSGLVMPAMTSMFLSWPMIIVGMSLHWPVIGWMYNSKTCLLHAIVRVALVTLLWFALPAYRFTLIPMAVSIIYLVTIFGLKNDVKKAIRKVKVYGIGRRA